MIMFYPLLQLETVRWFPGYVLGWSALYLYVFTLSYSWKQLGGSLDMCCAAQDEIWGVNSDCEIYRKKSRPFVDFNNAFDCMGLSEVHVSHCACVV